MKFLIVASLIVSVAFSTRISLGPENACTGSNAGINVIQSIDMTPCPRFPCELRQGKESSITVKFTAGFPASKASVKVYGDIAGVQIGFPLENENACSMGLNCPVSRGSKQSFTATVKCPSYAPQMKLGVIMKVRDANDNDLFCFQIPAEIISGYF